MSEYPESYAAPVMPPTGGPTAEPSATDVARDQAAEVGQHAREAGGQVAQTATDQARQVAAETSRQVRDLAGEAQSQAREQASAQQQKAAVQLHSVADELDQMATNSGQSGVATEFARQAAGRLHDAASWLEQREPADLLDEVRNFARRRPGTFLLGAAVAGLAAGRLTRGLAANRHGNGQPQASSAAAGDLPAVTADPAGIAVTDFPVQPEPVYSEVREYPAEPGYPVGSELGDPSVPAYPAGAAYPPEPAYPAAVPEPGTTPRYEGPR